MKTDFFRLPPGGIFAKLGVAIHQLRIHGCITDHPLYQLVNIMPHDANEGSKILAERQNCPCNSGHSIPKFEHITVLTTTPILERSSPLRSRPESRDRHLRPLPCRISWLVGARPGCGECQALLGGETGSRRALRCEFQRGLLAATAGRSSRETLLG